MKPDIEQYSTETPPSTAAPKPVKSGLKGLVKDVLETLLVSLLLFFAINQISARIRVDGFSMEPSMHSGEFVIVNKLAYKIGSPQPGDIIVFHPPRDPQEEYIKRVIGLPGDQVVIADGRVQVNGQGLDEPYILQPPRYSSSWNVPEGQLFVLGDNRNNSSDSHNWGPVPITDVIGKALFVYWPPENWGPVAHTSPGVASP